MAEQRTPDKKAKDVEKYLKVLADIRRPFEAMIDNITAYVNHSRRKITEKESQKGQKTGIEVYDDSAMLAKNLLVDGMVGYLCSRNIRWFSFSLPGKFNFPRVSAMRPWSGKRMDEYPQVKEWLQDCEDVMYSALVRSNFYDVISEFISDGATAGTAHILAEEDLSTATIIFTVPHFRECFIAENQWGRVDTNYRCYKLTLRQLADKFGMEKMKGIDRNFAKAYEDNMHQEKEVIHAVYPRSDYAPNRIDRQSKPIASLWVYREPLKLIDESGYDSHPTTTWRWRKNNDEWYGRSPSWDSYVAILTANQQGRTNLIAGNKMAEPAMVAPADLRGQINTGPNGWTFIDQFTGDIAARAPRPLNTGMQLPYAVDSQDRTDKRIREHFHVDFFLMLYQAAANKVDLTATQVVEMMGEKASVLGTRIGMLQSEGFDPILDRVFEIETRAGRIPAPPQILQELAGGTIQIEYLGPLSQAQTRLSKTRSIQSGIQMAAEIANVVGPVALDKIDVDAVMNEIFSASGFPEKCIRDDEEVKQIRDIRNKQAAEAAQIEAMPKIAKAMAAAGKATEKGSPMNALTGLPGEGEAANG